MEDFQTMRWALALVILSACTPKDPPKDMIPSTTTTASSTTDADKMDNDMINAWADRIARGEVVLNQDLQGLEPHRDIAPKLVDAFRSRTPMERGRLASVLGDLGVMDASRNIVHPVVVSALASMLTDPAPEVRNTVARDFSQHVPDDLVRNHAEEILSAIARYPDLDRAAWIVGRLGSQRARDLITSRQVGKSLTDVDRDVILAKLGDARAEQRSLERYRDAMKRDGDYAEVPRWTERAGYMATPGAAVALARDLRHPGVYPTHHGSERSVRADVVVALMAAFPHDVVPHLEFPESNADYERIEKWATARLGVTWDEPRPPFVYQAPSPSP